jgi:fibronectin-binding autotransporter adhesin
MLEVFAAQMKRQTRHSHPVKQSPNCKKDLAMARRPFSLASVPRRRTSRKHQGKRRQLLLEALEDRRVLDTYLWIGAGADGNWDNVDNWQGAEAPSGSGHTLDFNTANVTGSQYATHNNISGLTNTTIQIVDSSSAPGADFTLSGKAIGLSATGLTHTTNDPGDTTTISLALSGSGGVSTTGAGTLVLSGNNAYSGGTDIQAGTLQVGGGAVPGIPQAVYTFDLVSGSTVLNEGSLDAVKNGTLTSGASIATGNGIVGDALSIADNDDKMLIALSDGKGIDLAGADWTASAWFSGLKATSSWRTLFRGNSNDHQVIVENGSQRLGVFQSSGAGGGFRDSGYSVDGSRGGPDVTTGWHHITAVGVGDQTRLYIDGALVGSTDRMSATDIYAVGNYQSNGQPFADLIDEVYIYQTALNDSEVLQLYQASVTPRNAIPDASPVTVASGATLDLNNFSETLGPLSGSGEVILGQGALWINSTSSATLTGTVSGAGRVVKLGGAKQTLSGANTYTGSTTVLEGELDLGAAGNIGSTTSEVNVGALAGISGTLTISGGSLTASSITVGSLGTGTLNVSGATTAVTANANTGFGALVVGLSGNSVGTVNQTGGSVTVNNNYAILGRYGTAQGTYNISGGTLQTAGASGDRNLYMAWDAITSRGNVNLSGAGQITITGALQLGGYGTAQFTQTGGQVTVNSEFRMGERTQSIATLDSSGGSFVVNGTAYIGIRGTNVWNISGAATTFTVNNAVLEVGYDSTTTVNQTGGTVTANNSYIVLGRHANTDVTYNLSGGVLKTAGSTGNRRLHMAWDNAAK